MSMSEGIKRLLAVLDGLGFVCTNINSQNKNAQRKLSKQVNRWLSIIIWTTITKAGPLPKGQRAVKTILIGKQERLVWKLRKTLRYRNRTSFAKRLRRRVDLLIALAESRQQCPLHNESFMFLVVDQEDRLCWTCAEPTCSTQVHLDAALSTKIKSETSTRFWNEKKL
jgi:hypothetical protein